MLNISIRKLSSGYNVEVGCASFAIEEIEGRDTIDHILSKLGEYMRDPKKEEQKYHEKNVKKDIGIRGTDNVLSDDLPL